MVDDHPESGSKGSVLSSFRIASCSRLACEDLSRFHVRATHFLVDWKGRAPPTKYRSRVGVVSGICLIDVIDAWSSRCVCVIFVTLFVFYVHVVRVVGERCALSI